MNLTFGDNGSEVCDRVWSWIVSHPWPGWDIDVVHANADLTRMQWGQPPERRTGEPQGDRPTANLIANRAEFTEANTDPRALLAEVSTDLLVVGMKTRRPPKSTLVGSGAVKQVRQPGGMHRLIS